MISSTYDEKISNGEYHGNMSKTLPPSRTAPQFVIRFPDDDMRDRIAEAAKANGRSMNAEIVARLQSTFQEHQNGLTDDQIDIFEAELKRRMKDIFSSAERRLKIQSYKSNSKKSIDSIKNSKK